MKDNLVPMLITTDKRGVFFGYVDPQEAGNSSIRIYDVQMAVYWSADVQGVINLAHDGPSKSCRITKPGPEAILHGVTMALSTTKQAAKAWKKCPWG